MPLDRNNQNNPRPLKPTLASNRTAKAPLTPRLAVVPSTPAASSAQPSRPVRSSNGSAPRLAVALQEDTTPLKAFLSSNVSPRSSSRRSRIGAASATSTPNPTPLSTPLNSRPASAVESSRKESGSAHSALGLSGSNRLRAAPGQGSHAAPAPRLPLANTHAHPPSAAASARNASPAFFHADDVRPHEHTPAPPQKKAPVFFYANGEQDDTPRRHGTPSPPLSSLGRAPSESKFFHADSISEVRSAPPTSTPISTSPEPPLAPNPAHGASLRPMSPTKDWTHLSYRKGASQVIRPALHARSSGFSMLSGPNPPVVPEPSRRRSSTASSILRAGHMKSGSLSSIDSVIELKAAPSNESTLLAPSPLHAEDYTASTSSRPESVTSASSPLMTALSGLPSPGRISLGGQSTLEMMNELAANARRERKVLDLEISNSSLLAINRSLEKEIRKQKAELRRYRRLTRSGHFSVGPADSTSEGYSMAEANSTEDLSHVLGQDEYSGEEDSEVGLEEEGSEHSDSVDESLLSSNGQEGRDNVHHIRDEKRLQLDLSKHHEQLVDSQKMNQSLKRCLGWTEQLIKDGQKALVYKVRASDVKLGGRVLISEDDNDDVIETWESNTLLSPWSPPHRAADAPDSPTFNKADRVVDRDSGIHIESLKPASLSLLDHIPPLGSPFEERMQYLHASIDALKAA